MAHLFTYKQRRQEAKVSFHLNPQDMYGGKGTLKLVSAIYYEGFEDVVEGERSVGWDRVVEESLHRGY
jgi:hypothetical protein